MLGPLVAPGSGLTGFLEDYIPYMHKFGKRHDDFVDACTKQNIPDPIINIPSMPPVFLQSLIKDTTGSLGNFYNNMGATPNNPFDGDF